MTRSQLRAWANVTLALAGHGLVGVVGSQLAPVPLTLAPHGVGLLAVVLITLGVYAWAKRGEGYTFERLGFGQVNVPGRRR